jgi:hypothetical protein
MGRLAGVREIVVTVALLAVLAICLAVIAASGAVLAMIIVNWHYFTSRAGI